MLSFVRARPGSVVTVRDAAKVKQVKKSDGHLTHFNAHHSRQTASSFALFPWIRIRHNHVPLSHMTSHECYTHTHARRPPTSREVSQTPSGLLSQKASSVKSLVASPAALLQKPPCTLPRTQRARYRARDMPAWIFPRAHSNHSDVHTHNEARSDTSHSHFFFLH